MAGVSLSGRAAQVVVWRWSLMLDFVDKAVLRLDLVRSSCAVLRCWVGEKRVAAQ